MKLNNITQTKGKLLLGNIERHDLINLSSLYPFEEGGTGESDRDYLSSYLNHMQLGACTFAATFLHKHDKYSRKPAIELSYS